MNRLMLSLWCLFLLALPASATEGVLTPMPEVTPDVSLKYEVYMSGFHVVDTEIGLNRSARRDYDVVVTAITRGILGSFAEWAGTYQARGLEAHGKKLHKPVYFRSENSWQGEVKKTEISYDPSGRLYEMTVLDPDEGAEPKSIEIGNDNHSTDVLNAMVALFSATARDGNCNQSYPVFDGKRRFNLKFTDLGEEVLKPTKYNSFDGTARICSIEVEPVSGKWRKKKRGWMALQEEAKKRGELPQFWLGEMDEVSGMAIPVRVKVASKYGHAFMHLVDVKGEPALIPQGSEE